MGNVADEATTIRELLEEYLPQLAGGGAVEVTAEQIATAMAGALAALGIRASADGQAAGLYVPGLPEDSRSAAVIGSSDLSYSEIALEVYGGAEVGASITSETGMALFLSTNSADPEQGLVIGAQRRVPNSGLAPLMITGFNPIAPAPGAGYRHVHRLGGPYSGADVAYDDTQLSAFGPVSAERRVQLAKDGSMVEVMGLDTADSAGQTGLLLSHDGTLKRVKVGPAGSGPGGNGRALYLD